MKYNTVIKKVDAEIDYKDLMDNRVIEVGAEYLKADQVVAFPTETVYGLGARACSKKAVGRIFSVKGRPADNPLIVHLGEKSQLTKILGEKQNQISDRIQQLIDNFWPGPLTIIFPRGKMIPGITTAGLETMAVRMPSHPVARALITKTGFPLAAPSANTSGFPSPTTAQHVYQDLQGKLPLIIDGGSCQVGVESTVLDLSGNQPRILRPGAVTRRDISRIIGEKVIKNEQQSNSVPEGQAPRAPGMKYRHYSPATPVLLVHGDDIRGLLELLWEKKQDKPVLIATSETVAALKKLQDPDYVKVVDMGSGGDLRQVARNIFALLRKLDEKDTGLILVEAVPATGIGEAIMNRLYKAAQNNIYLS